MQKCLSTLDTSSNTFKSYITQHKNVFLTDINIYESVKARNINLTEKNGKIFLVSL